ncbi:hypothetical_protein [Candidozyma auris]|uniref:hypothetical_protein n=1 Tax=Candidozyma auris TaxID=498019 RepID=UPI001252A560|nr:hypothetical_protein [[Candida] auris]QEO23465.1 hypothetical_protein [[Candida] auris]
MIETFPPVSKISSISTKTATFCNKNPPLALLLASLQHFTLRDSQLSPYVDLWWCLSLQVRNRTNEAEFRRTQRVLWQTTWHFHYTYFRFRYLRHPVPRSVYRGYIQLEIEPEMSVEDVLDTLKRYVKQQKYPNMNLSKAKKSNIGQSLISLKDMGQCYVKAYKGLLPLLDNVRYVDGNTQFVVNVLKEPVPVLLFLFSERPPAVIPQLLTKHDEWDLLYLTSKLIELVEPETVKVGETAKETSGNAIDQAGDIKAPPLPDQGIDEVMPGTFSIEQPEESDALSQAVNRVTETLQSMVPEIRRRNERDHESPAQEDLPPLPMPQTLYSLTQRHPAQPVNEVKLSLRSRTYHQFKSSFIVKGPRRR